VGIVAASGTGAQQLLCLLDTAGIGVTAALGVGGRDLSAAVDGRSTRAALVALDEDPATELIVVVSKPPAAEVADAVREFAARLGTPVLLALIGAGRPDLTAAAEQAIRTLGVAVPEWPRRLGRAPVPRPGSLRGLFAGGTLCDEAMIIAEERLGPIGSNIPLRPEWRIDPQHPPAGHVMIDFGDDELTAGRPHPMIDQSLRLSRLAAEAADPATAVILMDVVLGHGAHPDPAGELAPAIAAAGDVAVVVSLIGAKGDPQGTDSQAEALNAAGAHVFASNAQATRFACELIESAP
jgi:FdrA protein